MHQRQRHQAIALTFFLSLIAALTLQILIGEVDTTMLDFPINVVAVTLLIIAAILVRRNNTLPKQANAIGMTSWLMFSLLLGFIPQGVSTEPSFLTTLGLDMLCNSWLFLWLSSWTIICITASLTSRNCSALLFKVGIILFVIALSWGRYDNTEGRAIARAIGPDNLITTYDGKGKELPFTYHYLPDADTRPDKVTLRLDTITTTIAPNHPAHHKGYDIYLIGNDRQQPHNPRYAILHIVKEPWKPIAMAAILMILLGVLWHLISKPLNHDRP